MGERDQPIGMETPPASGRGKWLVLTAALLGWMFDGLEQGLFPLVGRPALLDLLGEAADRFEVWFGVINCVYLVGAATGGVLFGWLGDRIGRMRAMTLSVLTYALCSGLCGFATSPLQLTGFRFLSSLGMGGEWALGVALVMEVWPDRSRSLLAGLIGAAANVGYLVIGVIGLGVNRILPQIESGLLGLGVSQERASQLVDHSGWRILMFMGAAPAVLTFLIRLFVPESERWQKEKGRGHTSNWATRDLIGVLVGTTAACGIIYLWSVDFSLFTQLGGTAVALVVATLGFLFPVVRYLQRSEGSLQSAGSALPTVRRMLLGACLGGVALLGTWGSLQWAASWADKLTNGKMPNAKAYTQICLACGAIVGTIAGALLGGRIGRRPTYFLLCLASLVTSVLFFRINDSFDSMFLFTGFLAGACTASFYGWLPLYLPELFPTRVRATGQGFSYNFGRVLATVGALQAANLMNAFGKSIPKACSTLSLIYVVGMLIIWLAPETHGQPLPE